MEYKNCVVNPNSLIAHQLERLSFILVFITHRYHVRFELISRNNNLRQERQVEVITDQTDKGSAIFQVSHLAALLTDLESLIEKKLSYKCQGNEAEISCHQRKIDLEVNNFLSQFKKKILLSILG